MDTSNEKLCYILLFLFDKDENASQLGENVNSIYRSDNATANIGKIIAIVEVDRHVTTVSIALELNIAQKTVWINLNKVL